MPKVKTKSQGTRDITVSALLEAGDNNALRTALTLKYNKDDVVHIENIVIKEISTNFYTLTVNKLPNENMGEPLAVWATGQGWLHTAFGVPGIVREGAGRGFARAGKGRDGLPYIGSKE